MTELRAAAEFGMIGVLTSGAGGDPHAPTAPWARDESLGSDALSARGAVSSVSNGNSDLPDARALQCVVEAYYGLSFPQPEGGIVTVVYPIMFSPGD